MKRKIPGMTGPARPVHLWFYFKGVDAAFERAVKAGCKPEMPPMDMFWGDRMGKVTDKWGNEYEIAEHIKDVTPEELEKGQKAFMAQMSKKK